MAFAITYPRVTILASAVDEQILAADANARLVEIENEGTGRLYYTTDGTTPSPSNGHLVSPGEVIELGGVVDSDPATGEGLEHIQEIRGKYFAGPDAGGRDGSSCEVNILKIANVP